METATTNISTLSLHDALPILSDPYRWMENDKDQEWLPFLKGQNEHTRAVLDTIPGRERLLKRDRKSTRLNSSHQIISYAVFCLKKKKKKNIKKATDTLPITRG